ncbi:MAG: TIGR02281 family clan AA aspartic protease [Qipengyuania sp.]|nr:TIGR02281 family clan AA aspartic protease [Qipengyuania sp.]
MRDALILAALTIGAVAALFPASEAETVVAAAASRATVESKRAPTPGASPAPAAGPTELHRAGDGHFYAPVTVGTRPVTMLVDTGASVVALTGEDARAAGVMWNPGQLTVVAQGASGPVRGVAVTLERVRLGGHEARGVAAVVIPQGLPISLLGQSFLKDVEPVRIEKDRMVLGSD